MKLGLGVVLLCFCTMLGYFLSFKYSDKKTFYNDYLDFIKTLKQEITFGQATLLQILEQKYKTTDFYVALNEFVHKNEFCFNKRYLNKDEISFFNEFLRNLGKSDAKTQVNYLDSVSDIVVNQLNQAILNESKYKTLYIKMGFLIGLVLLVLVL